MKPKVADFVDQYARSVFAFDATQPGEINLHKGDIIHVKSVVDDNWLQGELKGQVGNFPSSFVEKISLPAVHIGEKLFGALEKFEAQQDGDLGFSKGINDNKH